jgi:hypothetical protein
VPRSASPEVNVSAEVEAEQRYETLTSSGMSTLLVSSPVGLGGVGAFAKPGTKITSKASTQPRQLYDHVSCCPSVDVAAETGRRNSSATLMMMMMMMMMKMMVMMMMMMMPSADALSTAESRSEGASKN